eukprot:TRINITY_DN1941_c1_g1_i1.p1 TRINITY_DN1941_c1_g1~~TRINITY_DN1941_c1_g1_i1.p1  ORF type:complete len:365 (+),score=82.83 TRINITY_DN1941_c1_g1_i1:194-1288(+)
MVEGAPPMHRTLLSTPALPTPSPSPSCSPPNGLGTFLRSRKGQSLAHFKIMDIRNRARELAPHAAAAAAAAASNDDDQLTFLSLYTQELEKEYASVVARCTALEEKVRDLTEQMTLYSMEERNIAKLVSYPSEENDPVIMRQQVPAVNARNADNNNNRRTGVSPASSASGDWKWMPFSADEFTVKKVTTVNKPSAAAATSAGVAHVHRDIPEEEDDDDSDDEERKASSPSPISYLKVVKRSSNTNGSGSPHFAGTNGANGSQHSGVVAGGGFGEEDVEDAQKRGVLNFFLRRNGWFNYRTGDIVMRCRIHGALDMDEVKRIMPNLKVGTEKNNKLVKAHLNIGQGRILEKMAQIKKGSLAALLH